MTFWKEDGRRHLRIEEDVLLPIWAQHAVVDRPSVTRILGDHLAIRRWALETEARVLSVEDAHVLGELLDDHVRFEERKLFPLIETALDESALSQLAGAIERAETQDI